MKTQKDIQATKWWGKKPKKIFRQETDQEKNEKDIQATNWSGRKVTWPEAESELKLNIAKWNDTSNPILCS